MMLELKTGFRFVAVLFLSSIYLCLLGQSRCTRGCDLALGSFYVEQGINITSISRYMNTQISSILQYNRDTISNPEGLQSSVRINVPFTCECIDGEFLAHVFNYSMRSQDTYERIASATYANLTTAASIQRFNSYDPNRIPDVDITLNITVNCSCGDKSISKNYGLFVTYPLRSGETLDSVSSAVNLTSDLIRSYNPDANFSVANSLIYIPGRDENGNYPPLRTSSGLSGGAIGGIAVGIVAGVLLLAGCLYYGFYRNKNLEKSSVLLKDTQLQLMQSSKDSTLQGGSNSGVRPGGATPGLTGITVDKSVEFSYEELSKATNEFSLDNKIGQGGFGAVYYAELRGERVAIKKMDLRASREFLAELKVLTHVHHLNLVRLIGYCVEGSLFLVYEFIENGDLSQHLHGTSRYPLPWSIRVQIALDSARALEYIHEHTVPAYIHLDIKPSNILIDKNFHGKVADFGLTKLNEVGSTTSSTRPKGTWGYMPPEYARYGDVSPKVDVYAFGVVLYELISAKGAIVKANGSSAASKAAVALFDEVLSQPDPKEDDLVKMIDPRLGDNYPLDSVFKMAQLAKACTDENPQVRPSMISIVGALMTLSSSTEDWDVGSFYEKSSALLKNTQLQLMQSPQGGTSQGGSNSSVRPGGATPGLTGITVGTSQGGSNSSVRPGGATPGLTATGITVDISVEFSYEELSKATNEFSLDNEIGQGGFGAVYYAELRGKRAAIKKMDMQASREFLAELKVLTHVHHLNLVRLIGYCVEGHLFLVYEFIENGNLSQHLHGSARHPLSWSTRVQIALDSARGLEYIHDHTVPVYIHRDIKSTNILIDKNYHGKVADFGLTKLTEVGSKSLHTRLIGTFGYMPPEYAQYGDVSPKVDVYAFGIVLYELISAKEAIVKASGSSANSKELVALFDEVLSQPDPKDDLLKMIDPRLEDNYPLDSVRKMAQLAKACTHENPQVRPSMRAIVVALMMLSSSTEDWDVGSFYENQPLVSLMSGR